jgi:hypothetical protein
VKLAYTVKELSDESGAAVTRIRDAIASGQITVTYTSPKRYVIRHEEAVRWLDSLPTERSA